MLNKKALICSVIAASMLCTVVFAGCGENKEESSSADTQSSAAASDNEGGSDESKASQASQQEASKEESKDEDDETGPIPEIVDPTPESSGEMADGGIFVYNNVAYELFYGGESAAKDYAETISFVKKQLGDKFTLYNVVVPTHVGVDLPDKFKDLCNPQDTYLDTIVKSYSSDVKGVNAFNKIVHHRDEYLYFNSDHHWTALGAYYAYRAFAKAAGVTPVELSSLKSDKIEGYTGSFAYFSGRDDLKEDTVTYYYPSYNVDCEKYDENGENPQEHALLHTYAEGSNAYGVFLGGDEPILVTKNPQGNGKKIAVLKESYGNAFSPFIAYTYSEAHLIDFRYAHIDLKSYLEKNGITDVIIINNSMASATPDRLDELRAIVGGGYVDTNASEEESGTDETADTEEGGDDITFIDETGNTDDTDDTNYTDDTDYNDYTDDNTDDYTDDYTNDDDYTDDE